MSNTTLPNSDDIFSIFAKMQSKIEVKEERAREKHCERSRNYRKNKQQTRPFIGCDGEGSGIDGLGRQNYLVFRMGKRELCTGKRLTTKEIFEHILAAPSDAIHVGFAFGYDCTMILRDLPPERMKRLLAKRPPFTEGVRVSPYTYWGDYGIDYLPRQHLKVCRLESEGKKKVPVPGSVRTIFEVFGFFQGSFLKALESFGVDKEVIDDIKSFKDSRSDFNALDDDVRAYCEKECDLLAQMMEQLREKCQHVGYVPKTWSGAGTLAKAMFNQWNTMTREQAEAVIPPEVFKLANDAYYGGRFEITRLGPVEQPVFEYDINSAYPDAMTRLPCLEHGEWVPMDHKARLRAHRARELYVADVRFNHRAGNLTPLGGLPMRSRKGAIAWKARGNGVYWSCEIYAAEKLGTRIIADNGGYLYVKKCDCQPFPHLKTIYEYRKQLEREQKNKGMPLKLGINASYGTLAQRIGNGKYRNFIWAGLITAMTRAKLMDAISQAPDKIIMVATDGIYSLVPLDLDCSPGLGNWELNVFQQGLFVVMPGVYWDQGSEQGAKLKTRGVSARFIMPRREAFRSAWLRYGLYRQAEYTDEFMSIPKVPVTVTQFIGMKLAIHRGKPETAGKWVTTERMLSFDWGNKRSRLQRWEGDAAVVGIMDGRPNERTFVHGDKKLEEVIEQMGLSQLDYEDQPDVIELREMF